MKTVSGAHYTAPYHQRTTLKAYTLEPTEEIDAPTPHSQLPDNRLPHMEDDDDDDIRHQPPTLPYAIDVSSPMPSAAALALLPFVVAERQGNKVMYTFAPPASVRPASWPSARSLGTADGVSMQFVERTWTLYSQMLADAHLELVLKQATGVLPLTLPEAIALYQQRPEYQNLAGMEQEEFNKALAEIIAWSEANGNPPMATLAPEHIHALLLSVDGDVQKRQVIRDALDKLYQHALNEGYVTQNVATAARMPDHEWDLHRHMLPFPHPIQIFARPQQSQPAPMPTP
ncbi:MAG: hypothetical protein KGQ41_00550 [Alphaproteobacteria bacterium]|nr:hypothetical protein [Alphaproteobacteria bacterium]